ncbi:MAG: hypothetical protein IJ523_07180 [Succinivibrionaceae bacterium]|nr:hypothetical protein [Succinivibrionaceae bacterium]
MSQRSSMRSIAKARLQAMGVPHVNRVMGLGLSNSKNRKMQRTSQGRKQLANIQKKHIPVWRRVTTGSLAREGFKAQMGIGKKRRFRVAQ